MSQSDDIHITLIGIGTIGLSLAALHLTHLPSPSHLTLVDTRPDLSTYIHANLPPLLPAHKRATISISQINLTTSIATAVSNPHTKIIHESGPENLPFKRSLWHTVTKHAPPTAILWTSTSGIPASLQASELSDSDKRRLCVVHPFNPPHILPLLEIIPSPHTSADVVAFTMDFWKHARGRQPILVRKEITGFVAGRLAWALLREAIQLVEMGVVGVEELDRVMETSMGPRWAYAGPFKSFHAGGGEGGFEGLMRNVGGTVQACWDDGGRVNMGGEWEGEVFRRVREVYGVPDLGERDRANRRVLEVVEEEKRRGEGRGGC
ncbi:hypothetical protein FQN50_008082 [Emmonsiellopsis sp. PD_5]|nr:hypothetical protein FQN50_008082 [Emmonsiellopsis sp. PD_5]